MVCNYFYYQCFIFCAHNIFFSDWGCTRLFSMFVFMNWTFFYLIVIRMFHTQMWQKNTHSKKYYIEINVVTFGNKILLIIVILINEFSPSTSLSSVIDSDFSCRTCVWISFSRPKQMFINIQHTPQLFFSSKTLSIKASFLIFLFRHTCINLVIHTYVVSVLYEFMCERNILISNFLHST